MKKIILSSISLILVAAISLVALAATTGMTNAKIDKIKETKYQDGASFKIGNKSAPRYKDEEGLKAVDGIEETVWQTDKKGSYTQLTFDSYTSINNIYITEVGANVRDFHVEAWNGADWVSVYSSDILEGYRCAAIDPIKTLAIRLYIDSMAKNTSVKIAELYADYQRPIEFDREFINMSYVTSNYYFHQDWENFVNKEYYDNLTDVYLISNFFFDKDGNFVINQEMNSDNKTVKTYPALSDEAAILINGDDMSVLPAVDFNGETYKIPAGRPGYLKYVKQQMGEKSNPKFWFTLTCLQDTAFNGTEPSSMSAFNQKSVRDKFIADLVAFCKKFDFSGVDIDWEYPGTPDAWSAYSALITDLATALHNENLLLSSAQSSHAFGLKAEVLNKMDRINMMSYDQNSPSGHHSSYVGACVEDIAKYINHGIDPEKLVLGTAWYDKMQGYNGIFPQLKSIGFSDVEMKGKNFLGKQSFNGPNMVRDKTLYAIKRQIGGVFSWHAACDKKGYDEFSLGKAQDDTIKQYITYKEGTVLTDHTKK